MPLYEYSCPACGHQFEELTRSADADKIKCPKCSKKAQRKFSTFGVAMAPSKSSGGPPPGCGGCPGAGGGSCPYK
ncbi:MAG: zinc ribbon domain-containing protein [Phycisphaerae bacterium]|nr:zinc ribbon domain-containing protein [Phycisphaerae bacterium]